MVLTTPRSLGRGLEKGRVNGRDVVKMMALRGNKSKKSKTRKLEKAIREANRNKISIQLLTLEGLKRLRGFHGHIMIECCGCHHRFTEEDIGTKVIGVPQINRVPHYYHLNCFNKREKIERI